MWQWSFSTRTLFFFLRGEGSLRLKYNPPHPPLGKSFPSLFLNPPPPPPTLSFCWRISAPWFDSILKAIVILFLSLVHKAVTTWQLIVIMPVCHVGKNTKLSMFCICMRQQGYVQTVADVSLRCQRVRRAVDTQMEREVGGTNGIGSSSRKSRDRASALSAITWPTHAPTAG